MLINLINILLINLIIKIEGIHFYKDEIIVGEQTYNSYKFNINHHLSGISPYFESNDDQLNPNLPKNCEITKVAYSIRHGSVYVDDYDYDHIINPFLKRLNKPFNLLNNSQFSFLSKWKSPILNRKEEIEKLTKSGILESFELGVQLSYRYPKLFSKENHSSFHIWASSSQRTKQTAFQIFQGLFSETESNNSIISISEEKNLGANSLTPTKTCQKYNASKGSKEAKVWLKFYTKSIIKRFNLILPNFNFQSNDILAMQQLCGYETIIKGSSPFCSLFTSEEWISFEYYFDIKYYYELGYGNSLSPYLGIHWIKATTDLFQNFISNNQNIYISVVHREMIFVILVSLGLYDHSQYIKGTNIKTIFPLNEINPDRLWKSSQIIPFLSRIALEKFSCSSEDHNGTFIRIIVNSSPKPLPGCSQGPGDSCPLQYFIKYINQRYQLYKNFSKACQIDRNNTIDHLTFFQKNFF